jgi:hypothetical protein
MGYMSEIFYVFKSDKPLKILFFQNLLETFSTSYFKCHWNTVGLRATIANQGTMFPKGVVTRYWLET